MTIPVVKLKPKEDKRIKSGHLWVFSNEITKIDGAAGIGDVVEVRSKSDESLSGFIQRNLSSRTEIFLLRDSMLRFAFGKGFSMHHFTG